MSVNIYVKTMCTSLLIILAIPWYWWQTDDFWFLQIVPRYTLPKCWLSCSVEQYGGHSYLQFTNTKGHMLYHSPPNGHVVYPGSNIRSFLSLLIPNLSNLHILTYCFLSRFIIIIWCLSQKEIKLFKYIPIWEHSAFMMGRGSCLQCRSDLELYSVFSALKW